MSMRHVTALEQRIRHMQRPHTFRAHRDEDAQTFGQHIAEVVAGAIGSWGFIGGQAALMVVWVLVNTLAFLHRIAFDSFPFVFLNLTMSAEAAFTGPILLIAANVGAIRDHRQYDRMEAMERRHGERFDALEAKIDALATPAPVRKRATTATTKAVAK